MYHGYSYSPSWWSASAVIEQNSNSTRMRIRLLRFFEKSTEAVIWSISGEYLIDVHHQLAAITGLFIKKKKQKKIISLQRTLSVETDHRWTLHIFYAASGEKSRPVVKGSLSGDRVVCLVRPALFSIVKVARACPWDAGSRLLVARRAIAAEENTRGACERERACV